MKFDVPSSGSASLGLWVGLSRNGAAFDFGGCYEGSVSSANGSSATAELTMTQTGTGISGDLAVGTGLSVSTGLCGTHAVPSMTFGPFTGSAASPHLATGSFTQNVMGFDVTGNFTGTLSADGTTMSVTLGLDVPFPCSDSTLTGGFSRVACP